MDKMPILTFRLAGPLQSWGEHSKWDYRDTADFPSKSAIVGLLSCALGWERGNEKIVKLSESIDIIVRADRKGTFMEDFNTIMSDNLICATGKKRGNGGTIISRRDYIEDGCFTVFISASIETLKMCNDALERPVWTLYLGRKCCAPMYPIIGKIINDYSSLEEAVLKLPLDERHDKVIMYQKNYEHGYAVRRMDDIQNSAERTFKPRLVEICTFEG